jgi:hypothetical protein
MVRSERIACCALLLTGGCADLIGADFDAVPLSPGSTDVLFAGDYPYDIAVDATHVYWTSIRLDGTGTPGVWRIPIGGGPEELISDGVYPNRLALSDEHVYWSDSGTDSGADSSIRRWAKSGASAPETIADGVRGAFGLALDGDFLWFASSDELGSTAQKVVYRVPLEPPFDRTPYTLVDGRPTFIGVRNETVWGLSTSGFVFAATALASSGDLPVAANLFALEHPNGLAVRSASEVFVGQINASDGGSIFRVNTLGMVDATAPDQGDVGVITIDGDYVYWASFSIGRLARKRTDVGPVEILLADQPSINGVAVGGDRIYFTRHEARERGGAIGFIAKP